MDPNTSSCAMAPPATPGTPLWSTTTNAARAGGAAVAGAAAGGGGGGGAGRRRKTLSPSKALTFLASSFDGDEPAGTVDVENVPPPGVAGAGGIKSLIKGNGAWASAPAAAGVKSSSLAPQPLSAAAAAAAAGSTLFHAPVYVTWAKGGGREAGALWLSSSSPSPAEEEVTLSWLPKEPAPSGGLGARGDIRNLASALADADPAGKPQQPQQQQKAIVFGRGRVLSASFVWLDASTPGLSVVLAAPEAERDGGSGTAIAFLDFKGGKEAEPAARRALGMLQQCVGGGVSVTTAPAPALAPVEAEQQLEGESAVMGEATGVEEGEVEVEDQDLAVLVRRFLKAKLHSPAAKALARRVYRLTGYPLLSFGTIQAAARGDTDPAPLEPRTQPLAMREMRAMVLSLEPILKGMNATHQKGIKESEARTGARTERRKDGGGCYRYTDLASNQEISPASYRARYMAGLEAVATERRAATAAAEEEEAATAAEAVRVLELEGEEEEGPADAVACEVTEEAAQTEPVDEKAAPVQHGEEEEAAMEEEPTPLPIEADESIPLDEKQEGKEAVATHADAAEPETLAPLPIAANAGAAVVEEPEPEALASLPIGADEGVVVEKPAAEEQLDLLGDEGEDVQEATVALEPQEAAPTEGQEEEEEDGQEQAAPAPSTPAAAPLEEEDNQATLASILGDDDEGSTAGGLPPSSSAATASPLDVSAILRTPHSCAPSTTSGRRSSISVISSGLRRLNLGLGDEEEEEDEQVQQQSLAEAAVALDDIAAEEDDEELVASPEPESSAADPEEGQEAPAPVMVVNEEEAEVEAEAEQAVESSPLKPALFPGPVATQGLAPEELQALAEAAEAKLHLAIDDALRRYHRDLSAAHAAAVARLRCGRE